MPPGAASVAVRESEDTVVTPASFTPPPLLAVPALKRQEAAAARALHTAHTHAHTTLRSAHSNPSEERPPGAVPVHAYDLQRHCARRASIGVFIRPARVLLGGESIASSIRSIRSSVRYSRGDPASPYTPRLGLLLLLLVVVPPIAYDERWPSGSVSR